MRIGRFLPQLLRLAALSLVSLAICQELRKPAAVRTWSGLLFGVVPYNFNLPSAAQLRRALWSPDDARLLTGHVFGIGWAINFGALWRRLAYRLGA